jgi:hypothetical protein
MLNDDILKRYIPSKNTEERKTQTALLPQGSNLYSFRTVVCFLLSSSQVSLSLDDYIHVIEKVNDCFLLWFCCKQTHHRTNRMQFNVPTMNHQQSRTESMHANA